MSSLDDVLAAVGDAHVAQRVNAGHIAGAEPVVLVYRTGIRVLHHVHMKSAA